MRPEDIHRALELMGGTEVNKVLFDFARGVVRVYPRENKVDLPAVEYSMPVFKVQFSNALRAARRNPSEPDNLVDAVGELIP